LDSSALVAWFDPANPHCLKTLDLCHVSAAQQADRLFVTADRKQLAAAKLEGLETVFVGD
jgi:predicted nucleic acid-binding protein